MLVLNCHGLFAQFFETGQSPASLRWRQINSTNFRVIYPETFDGQIYRLTRILEESWETTGHTLDHQPRRIPVIIHNHHARSNGMVVWAPRRMELYPIHPRTGRGGDWLTQLALHEQRHVVQVDKLNQGITRIFSWLIGEQAIGATAGRIPPWFYEGDAVVTETVLTEWGRGRRASFDMPMRTLLLSRPGIFGYDKFLHGSFRDFVPDHYQHGYYLVSGLRREYGPGLWSNAMDFTARRPYFLTPFMRSLRNDTGLNIAQLHQDVLAGFFDELMPLYDTLDLPEYGKINRRKDDLYLNYHYPVWIGDTAVIALKSGIGHADELVIVDLDGNENSIIHPAVLSSPVIAQSGSRIAWTEYQPDLRWSLNDHSVIRVHDFITGHSIRIGSKSRYFSPAFAPGGLFIAVVETDFQNRDRIVLLNSVTGEVAASWSAPSGVNIQLPVFDDDGNRILAAGVSEKGTSIVSLDRHTGRWSIVMELSHSTISRIFPCDGHICFNSDLYGTDNIFSLDEESGNLYRITSSPFGGLGGSFSPDGSVVWSDYTWRGFDLAFTDFDPLPEDEPQRGLREELVEALSLHESGNRAGSNTDTTLWQSVPYRKGANLFNFHSWAPFYLDYGGLEFDELPVWPGLTLLSQNLLNTASTQLGYSYVEGNHVVHGNFAWKGWYPVIEAGFDYGSEPRMIMGSDTIGPPGMPPAAQLNLTGAVYVPLNLSRGRYIAGLQPRLIVNYDNSLYHYENQDYQRGMVTMEARLWAFRQSRRSFRDLAPRWGQTVLLRRFDAPFEPDILGSISSLELTLYFPGLFPHHSLKIEGALQRQDPERYLYTSMVRFPRGYPRETTESLQIIRNSYSFPFLYPDFNIPGVLYIKRFSADLFADFGINRWTVAANGNLRREEMEERLFSWGGGITTNFHVLRLIFPINASVAIARIPGRNEIAPVFSLGMMLQ